MLCAFHSLAKDQCRDVRDVNDVVCTFCSVPEDQHRAMSNVLCVFHSAAEDQHRDGSNDMCSCYMHPAQRWQ